MWSTATGISVSCCRRIRLHMIPITEKHVIIWVLLKMLHVLRCYVHAFLHTRPEKNLRRKLKYSHKSCIRIMADNVVSMYRISMPSSISWYAYISAISVSVELPVSIISLGPFPFKGPTKYAYVKTRTKDQTQMNGQFIHHLALIASLDRTSFTM